MFGQSGQTSLVSVYDEFYKRLFLRATCLQQKFPGLKARAGLLYRIVYFLCSIEFSKLDIARKQLKKLGTTHAHKNLSLWMYSVFSETLVETVMFCLGPEASVEVRESWCATLSFCLKIMIEKGISHCMNYDGMDFSQQFQFSVEGSTHKYLSAGAFKAESIESSFDGSLSSRCGIKLFPESKKGSSEELSEQSLQKISEKISFKIKKKYGSSGI